MQSLRRTRLGKSDFCKAVSRDLKHLGLNTLGIHTDSRMLNDPPVGFIVENYEPVILSHHLIPEPETYGDIFAPTFKIQCDLFNHGWIMG
jgi:ribonuclease HIII